MAKEYSNTEWIELYLRGELHGNDLEQFEAKLNKDIELKNEFNIHHILADAIIESKKKELKSYLSQYSKAKKRSLFEYNWVFSAAAAVALLVASVSVYFIVKKPGSTVAQQEIIKNIAKGKSEGPQFNAADKNDNQYSQNNEDISKESVATDSVQTVALNDGETNTDQEGINDDIPVSDNFKTSDNQAQMVYTTWMAVSQQLEEKLEDAIKSNETTGVRTVSKNESTQKRIKNKTADVSSTTSSEKITLNDTISLNKKYADVLITSLQVSFYETKSGKMAYSQNGKELKLYNISYSDPRIYYKNRFLILENGGKTYDINAKGIELDLKEIEP